MDNNGKHMNGDEGSPSVHRKKSPERAGKIMINGDKGNISMSSD